MEKTLHVGYPHIGSKKRFFELAEEVFEERWLTNRGKYVREFEQRLAEYLGVRHCITLCNGTVALEIAARALGLKGEVILPSLTFVATAHAMQWQEITPVFCDIDRESYCIDPHEIERHVTPKTTGIVGVHLYGRPCDVDAIGRTAQRRGLKVIYDASHAFGCTLGGRRIGGNGDCEVFSFHATKIMNTFEGGAIATNDDELAEKVRLMQNFGFEKMDTVIYIGTNGKMNEISAAMGLVNLDHLDEFIAVNRRNYEAYREGFRKIEGLRMMEYDGSEECNYQYIVTEVTEDFHLNRDELMSLLHSEKVRVRRYFWPGCHNMEPYRSDQPNAGVLLPRTEEAAARILLFPTGAAVDEEIIEHIMKILRRAGRR